MNIQLLRRAVKSEDSEHQLPHNTFRVFRFPVRLSAGKQNRRTPKPDRLLAGGRERGESIRKHTSQ